MVESSEYITIRLTQDVGDLIDLFLKDKKLGYTSRADVVRAALREFYENRKKDGLLHN